MWMLSVFSVIAGLLGELSMFGSGISVRSASPRSVARCWDRSRRRLGPARRSGALFGGGLQVVVVGCRLGHDW